MARGHGAAGIPEAKRPARPGGGARRIAVAILCVEAMLLPASPRLRLSAALFSYAHFGCSGTYVVNSSILRMKVAHCCLYCNTSLMIEVDIVGCHDVSYRSLSDMSRARDAEPRRRAMRRCALHAFCTFLSYHNNHWSQ